MSFRLHSSSSNSQAAPDIIVSGSYLHDLIAPPRSLPLLPVLNNLQISQSSQYGKKAKELYTLLKSKFNPKAKGLITVYSTLHPGKQKLLFNI